MNPWGGYSYGYGGYDRYGGGGYSLFHPGFHGIRDYRYSPLPPVGLGYGGGHWRGGLARYGLYPTFISGSGDGSNSRGSNSFYAVPQQGCSPFARGADPGQSQSQYGLGLGAWHRVMGGQSSPPMSSSSSSPPQQQPAITDVPWMSGALPSLASGLHTRTDDSDLLVQGWRMDRATGIWFPGGWEV